MFCALEWEIYCAMGAEERRLAELGSGNLHGPSPRQGREKEKKNRRTAGNRPAARR
jgi:hypothetical protein